VDAAPETAAPALVATLIRQAEAASASDVHLQSTPRGIDISFRLDGQLCAVESHEGPVCERVLGRIKYLAKLPTWQDDLPQDGRIAKEDAGSMHDIRVATYPTVTGEKIVLRLFQQNRPPTLADLHHRPEVKAELERFLEQPDGLMLLTAPAGSGKTTTIYACLSRLAARGDRHIITIEDPVEQVLDGVMQTEINEARGLTYAKAARHLLRQDPQVLVLGEIRDAETAQIAVRTALTGHQVISTLHAGSCRAVWDRLRTLHPDSPALDGADPLIINQRLLRSLCNDCHGRRCDQCLQTGYRGRLPIAEWLRFDAVLQNRTHMAGAERPVGGSATLHQQAAQWLKAGLTDETEIRRVLGPAPSLE